MTSTPETPDDAALADLRKEIDELKAASTEELIDPQPAELLQNEPTPSPTDAIGSERWDRPADQD